MSSFINNMSSLLPDDYMATGSYDNAMEQSPESGFDETQPPIFDPAHHCEDWKPISHSDTFTSSSASAFDEPMGVPMLTQSAPMFYHSTLTSMSLPNSGFAMPAARANHLQQMMAYGRAVEQHSIPEEYTYGAPMGYPMAVERMDDGYRGGANGANRARNTSAPPVPMMMAPPQMNGMWSPNAPMLSASYGDYHAMSQSYEGGFPMAPERKYSNGRGGGSSSGRGGRRPVNVPALSFTNLNSGGSAHSPASAHAMVTPHSGRSMSSMSDFDSQFSPISTPRSTGSTPRSSTSTPRSGVTNEKKRARTGLPHPLERERRVRPKVVAEKGALQCKGVNRKKNTRCRNAALMEYIGPRPLYCAEHITLDPESFYSKCASSFHKVHGDGKGCREVVLKELQFCHKHYNQALDVLLDGSEVGFLKARAQLDRIVVLQTQLESEAALAKRVDPDLFQRKHKLIPKFMEMRKLLVKRMQEFETSLGHLLPASIDFKYDEHDSKDSSSITTSSPSGSSDEASVNYDEPTQSMMQVEPQSYSVY